MKYIKYLLVILALFISGCNFNRDGLYTFKYIEYNEDGKIKQSDCSNRDELPYKTQIICDCKDMKIEIKDNYYTFSMTEGHIEEGYFYIVNSDMYLNDTEEGDYTHTGWFHYKNNKIYYGINQTYVVLQRR